MFKELKKVLHFLFTAVNIVVVIAMILCSYTYHLNSRDYPDYSYWGMLLPLFLAASVVFILFWLFVHWRYILISIVGIVICFASIRDYIPINFSSKMPVGAFKVLSYNVMGFGDFSETPWEENGILNYILRSEADIVCLQEANNIPLATLHQSSDSIFPYVNIDSLQSGVNLMLLSKYPIISSEQIRYESSSNGSFASRVVRGSDTILVVNNHFESYHLVDKDKDDYKSIIRNPDDEDNEEKYELLVSKLKNANYTRAAQADSVAQYIERARCKYVLCMGDFNAPTNSYTHYRLTRLLNDAYTRSGCGIGFSYNRAGMYFRIDNILVSENIKAYNAKVDDYSKMSDHYPIYSWLELQ